MLTYGTQQQEQLNIAAAVKQPSKLGYDHSSTYSPHCYAALHSASAYAGKYSDAINVELLQMATLLMRNLPNSMATHRKELIKFGWNHLKREESSNKYHAFLNVCHFLEAYQAPEKIVLQVISTKCVAFQRGQPEACFLTHAYANQSCVYRLCCLLLCNWVLHIHSILLTDKGQAWVLYKTVAWYCTRSLD